MIKPIVDEPKRHHQHQHHHWHLDCGGWYPRSALPWGRSGCLELNAEWSLSGSARAWRLLPVSLGSWSVRRRWQNCEDRVASPSSHRRTSEGSSRASTTNRRPKWLPGAQSTWISRPTFSNKRSKITYQVLVPHKVQERVQGKVVVSACEARQCTHDRARQEYAVQVLL